jgi:hypothetical protein
VQENDHYKDYPSCRSLFAVRRVVGRALFHAILLGIIVIVITRTVSIIIVTITVAIDSIVTSTGTIAVVICVTVALADSCRVLGISDSPRCFDLLLSVSGTKNLQCYGVISVVTEFMVSVSGTKNLQCCDVE